MQSELLATGLVSIEISYFLLQLAIILFSAKMLGMVMRRFGLPQVLGFILAGVLFGPTIWSYFFHTEPTMLFPIGETAQLDTFAKIGVILILFTAGLETNLDELKHVGIEAFFIALGGVIVPLALGFLLSIIFYGTGNLLKCVFIGVILTATSVGITVETLREIGKLKGKIGTIILSAAIIDDIIGILVLSIVLSVSKSGETTGRIVDLITHGNVLISILWIGVYVIVAIGAGIGISILFKRIEKKKPNLHRVPIMSLVVCFIYAFVSEEIFGVADITGAYIAGVVLSTNHRTAEYADSKISVNSYVIFAPIFFFNIGRQVVFDNMTPWLLLFTLCFRIVGISGKIIGWGGMGLLFKNGKKDSLKLGVGMIARGEVCLIVAERGISGGLIGQEFITVAVLFVFATSLLAPIMLKKLYKNKPIKDEPNGQNN